jgi:hypothetical protein
MVIIPAPEKVASPIVVSILPLSKSTLVKRSQSSKAWSLIYITVFGMVIFLNPEVAKAEFIIVVNLLPLSNPTVFNATQF